MELSNEFILKDSLKRIEEIYSVASELYKNEEYEQAFRMLNSGSTFLGILNALDQSKFLTWKVKFIGIQCNICIEQNKPDYNSYLFYYTSSFCYSIIQELAQFPTSANFFRWRELFKNTPNEFFFFNKHSEFNNALTELKLIKHKDLILERIFKFCFEKLPIIYGIKPKYLNQVELDKYFKERVAELYNVIKECELLSSKDLSLVTVKIGNSVREIYDIKI
ncbi:hypothetical protein [Algibacter sp. PT7-4]|uniref:hypothetical protein n=1 Tax=Algibacter ulvanivorans TaxID=3400999 RepID=UPI003AADE87C